MSSPKRPNLKPVGVRGIDHLALITDDMPMTMDFYTRVLRMQLVHVRRVPFEQDRGQPPYEDLRHYFFNMGNDTFLAFFEYPKDLERANRDLPGGMQHLAFHVPKDEFDELCDHVKSCGVDLIGLVHLELATSIADANLSVIESGCQTEAEARAELETLFDDPAEIEKWLQVMPLVDEEIAAEVPAE